MTYGSTNPSGRVRPLLRAVALLFLVASGAAYSKAVADAEARQTALRTHIAEVKAVNAACIRVRRDPAQVVADCDRAIAMGALDLPRVLSARALGHLRGGALDLAAIDVDHALRLNPDYGYAQQLRTNILSRHDPTEGLLEMADLLVRLRAEGGHAVTLAQTERHVLALIALTGRHESPVFDALRPGDPRTPLLREMAEKVLRIERNMRHLSLTTGTDA